MMFEQSFDDYQSNQGQWNNGEVDIKLQKHYGTECTIDHRKGTDVGSQLEYANTEVLQNFVTSNTDDMIKPSSS